jgi:CheY-like chemotaxis protein
MVSSAKPVILVVEDEMSFRQVYTDALEHLGLTVIAVADGEEAWGILWSQKIDLVLLDLILPKIDGLALLQLMKAEDITKEIPVVVSSVIGDEVAVQQAMKLGAHKYLHKGSTSIPEIARTVKQIAKSHADSVPSKHLKIKASKP